MLHTNVALHRPVTTVMVALAVVAVGLLASQLLRLEAMPDITFGAVSLQLKALADAGLVTVRAEGRYRYYRARREALGPVRHELERMWDSALWRLKVHAELRQARRGPRPGTPRAARSRKG